MGISGNGYQFSETNTLINSTKKFINCIVYVSAIFKWQLSSSWKLTTTCIVLGAAWLKSLTSQHKHILTVFLIATSNAKISRQLHMAVMFHQDG